MNRDYELGFILTPEVNEEQTRAILERLEQIATNYGGQVVRVNQWGRRRLAYPIQHHRDGFYVFIDMMLPPETVIELDRTLKVSEEVLRHLMKRRDSKTALKEREARAAAQAQPASPPEAEAQADADEIASAEIQPEVQEGAESEALPVLSAEENDYVPLAIEEEETVEA